MTEYKNLYLPLFYNWYEMTETLSDEEFGVLIRSLLLNAKEGVVPKGLPDNVKIAYMFMMDGAKRVHESQKSLSERCRESANKRWHKDSNDATNMRRNANVCDAMPGNAINENGNKNENENVNVNGNENVKKRVREKQKKENYGSFDTEYAVKKALERTFKAFAESEQDEDT